MKLAASMTWVECPFCSFLLLASRSDFHTPQLDFLGEKSMTMVFAGAIRGEYSPDGCVQWHLGLPWTWFVGRCAWHRTTWFAWPSKWPTMEAHLFVIALFFAWLIVAKQPCYCPLTLIIKPSCQCVHLMLLVRSYLMVARRRQWMPFWLPLSTAGEWIL